jgi:DNA sulfur modification protein DndD
MIKKLVLNGFGKFIKKINFDFSPVTFFFGRNEAGKSTIFDALSLKLCEYNFRGSNPASLMRERYGEDMDEKIICENSFNFKVPMEDFLNIYAIRYGEASVTMGKNWVTKVTSSLMTGGINPKSIYEDLNVFNKESLTIKHNKNKNKLIKSIEKLDKEINEQQENYKEKIKNYDSIEFNKEKISKLDNDINVLKENIDELEREIKKQDELSKKPKYQDIKNRLNNYNSVLEKLKEKENFKEDRSNEILSLETKINEIKNELISLDSKLDSRKENIEESERKILNLRFKEEEFKKENNLVNNLLEELDKNRSISPKLSVNKWGLMLGALFMVSSVSLGIYMDSVYYFLGILISLVLFFKSFKKGKNVNEFISRIKERYEDATSKTLKSKDLLDLKSDLSVLKKEYDSFIEKYNKEKDYLDDLTTKTKEIKNIKEEKISVYNSLCKEKDNLFKILDAKDTNDYFSKLTDYKNLKERKKELENDLQKSQEEFSKKSTEDLNNFLTTQIEIIGNKFLDEDKKTESEIKKDKMKLGELRSNLEIKKEERNTLDKRTESEKSTVEETIGFYDTKSLEEDKHSKEEELYKLNLEIEASKIAASLFKTLSEDSVLMFNQLSKEVSEKFGQLLPSAKQISIHSIEEEKNILIEDEGGVKRKPQNLSTGTKDLFYFALRLVLIGHYYNKEVPFVLLDEPFHSLDKDRILKALKLLNTFQKEHNCQIIMFSKDSFLCEQVEKEFKNNLKLHKL